MTQIEPGVRLGPYEILAPIGAGGMGEVWRGRDTRLDRSVAIKILPSEFAQNAELKLRFEREARVISQLNHPHICTLYDVGESFLVMELLEGESLADRISRGPLPIAETIRYGIQIAEALDRAHRAGIVHRDLKPANVIVTRSGAKLLDFGLAKSHSGVVSGEGATVQKSLTEQGVILGTFQYMAPEQLEGEEADARTDIFSFGALLYEMSTGTRAFQGKTKTSLIAAIVSSQPRRLSEIQPLTPAAFEHVVQKCLEKEPDRRWQSAHDIAEELRWIAEAGSQGGVAAPIAKKRKAAGWTAAIVAAIVAGIFAASPLHLFQSAPKSYRLMFPTIDADYRGVVNVVISPDGQNMYFVGTTPDNKRSLFRRRVDDFRAVPLEGTGVGGFGFSVTPDNRSLIVSVAGGVYKRISVDGGAPVLVGVADAGATAAAASDGTILVGSSNLDAPIRRVLPDHPEALFPLDSAHGEVGQIWPTFLPDRKRFRFVRRWPFIAHEAPRFLFLSVSREPARGAIHFTLCAASLGSKEVKRIGDVPSRVEYGAGHLFFVRDGTLMAQPFDTDKLEFEGDAIPVIGDVFFNSRRGLAEFSVSRDGTIVCMRAIAASHLTWVDRTGKKISAVGNVFALATPIFGSQRINVSLDGSSVVLSINDPRSGLSSLWTQGLTHPTTTRVTFSPAAEQNPVVARDGSRVFFASDATSLADIFEAPLDGSTPAKPLVLAPNAQIPNDVSPDGRFLLYTSNENQIASKQDLWILPLNGHDKPYPFLATPAVENAGVFSADGKWIAYVSDVTGTVQVYVRPFPGPGAARPVSIAHGTSPRFSADGKQIYFLDGNKLLAADFHGGVVSEPKELFELSDRISTYEPVGDRFLMMLTNDIDASPPARVIVNWRPPA